MDQEHEEEVRFFLLFHPFPFIHLHFNLHCNFNFHCNLQLQHHQEDEEQQEEEVRSFLLFHPLPFIHLHFILHCNFNFHCNLELQHHQEDEEQQEEVPSSSQQESMSERPGKLWVRGPNKIPKPPKTEAEKIRLEPTKM